MRLRAHHSELERTMSMTRRCFHATAICMFGFGIFAADAECAEMTECIRPLASTQDLREIREPDGIEAIEIVELRSIGSLDDSSTAFGQISDAAFGPDQSIYVADLLNHHVRRFSFSGEFLGTFGRQGNGPGEFQWPWKVAVDENDTLVVWDQRHRRFTKFGPEGMLVGTFNAPGNWLVTSMHFSPEGNLVVGAFGPNETYGVHVIDPAGDVVRSFASVDLDGAIYPGMIGSLAGGYADAYAGGVLYGHKSPYRIDFFTDTGEPVESCVGPAAWTTPHSQGWRRSGTTTEILWDEYKHVGGVFALDGNRVLTVILDPANERSLLQIVTSDCVLEARGVVARQTLEDRSGDYFLAVPIGAYVPEVRVVELRLQPPDR